MVLNNEYCHCCRCAFASASETKAPGCWLATGSVCNRIVPSVRFDWVIRSVRVYWQRFMAEAPTCHSTGWSGLRDSGSSCCPQGPALLELTLRLRERIPNSDCIAHRAQL